MSNKRFRDANGNLTMPSEKIAEATWEEANEFTTRQTAGIVTGEKILCFSFWKRWGMVMTPDGYFQE